jgi:hypothetical protein
MNRPLPSPSRPVLSRGLALLLLVGACGDPDAAPPPAFGDPTILLVDAAEDVSRMLRLAPGSDAPDVVRPALAPGARGLTLDRTEGILYWASRDGDRIQLGRWTDASVSDLPVAGLDSAYAVEYLASEDALYWSDYGTDAIHRIPLGGGEVEIVVDGLVAPRQIAIDEANRVVYWVDRGAGRVESIGLDGGEVTVWAEGLAAPYGLALHPSEPALLVGDAEEGVIYRIDLDTGEREMWLADAGTHPSFLAVDSSAATLYWTDNRDNVLRRRALGGGAVEVLASGMEGPRGLVLIR